MQKNNLGKWIASLIVISFGLVHIAYGIAGCLRQTQVINELLMLLIVSPIILAPYVFSALIIVAYSDYLILTLILSFILFTSGILFVHKNFFDVFMYFVPIIPESIILCIYLVILYISNKANKSLKHGTPESGAP